MNYYILGLFILWLPLGVVSVVLLALQYKKLTQVSFPVEKEHQRCHRHSHPEEKKKKKKRKHLSSSSPLVDDIQQRLKDQRRKEMHEMHLSEMLEFPCRVDSPDE